MPADESLPRATRILAQRLLRLCKLEDRLPELAGHEVVEPPKLLRLTFADGVVSHSTLLLRVLRLQKLLALLHSLPHARPNPELHLERVEAVAGVAVVEERLPALHKRLAHGAHHALIPLQPALELAEDCSLASLRSTLHVREHLSARSEDVEARPERSVSTFARERLPPCRLARCDGRAREPERHHRIGGDPFRERPFEILAPATKRAEHLLELAHVLHDLQVLRILIPRHRLHCAHRPRRERLSLHRCKKG
mmetsp:Transcript_3054/g.11071  ORF Transcript_3054/g.11071 Transcript_3054/m.11071 type:complete len:253 (-) Transcript_3054:496-1254(-)